MNRVIKTKSKIKKFNIFRSVNELSKMLKELPKESECFKFVSMGGFSSIVFIKFISEKTVIKNLNVSTLRVGKKELKMLDILYKKELLQNCNFVIGSLMANDSQKVKGYHYYLDFKKVCDNNNWTYSAARNHSKILLFDTDVGKFVIETSSNLNENPRFEQFSFEKSNELYDFYLELFEGLKKKVQDVEKAND